MRQCLEASALERRIAEWKLRLPVQQVR
jgi:hypothetical protein